MPPSPSAYPIKDMAFHTRRADILIVAAGRPKAITADMIKERAVVIDVGVDQIGTTCSGKRILVGDVCGLRNRERKGFYANSNAGWRGTNDHHNADVEYLESHQNCGRARLTREAEKWTIK